jgi:hypothetical protein
MKTKLVSLLVALLGFNINAAASSINGSAGASFSSEYHRRGQVVSQDSIQAQVGAQTNIGGLNVNAEFFTSQATESGETNSNEITISAGGNLFEDKVSAYIGIYNTDMSNLSSVSEGFLEIGINSMLKPTARVFRGTSNNLNTFEGELSHTFDLDLANLELKGLLGNTETSSSTDLTYSSLSATLSRDLSENFSIYADVSISDTNTRDYETFWGTGVSVKF